MRAASNVSALSPLIKSRGSRPGFWQFPKLSPKGFWDFDSSAGRDLQLFNCQLANFSVRIAHRSFLFVSGQNHSCRPQQKPTSTQR